MGFEFENNAPIYIQIIEQIKTDIISGNIDAGQRLPSVRDIAVRFKVNPNTVQKALSDLEGMGLIYTERTNGKFVTDDIGLIEQYKKEYADILSEKFLLSMKSIGYDENTAIDYLKKFGGNENGAFKMH